MPEIASHPASAPLACIFSVDVEDWFHILDVPSTPAMAEWDRLPSRVERNFHRLLDLFSEYEAKVTCFFLGWVAERYPGLVREAVERGHEIASHGYAHQLVSHAGCEDFRRDARRSRDILEQIAGAPVMGFRAPGFSVVGETPWFFQELEAAGYRYDSSVFPAAHGHGGLRAACRVPHRIAGTERLVEFPITVADTFGRPMCFFGGGYLRLFPLGVILHKSRQVLREQRPLVYYVHPREIDPEHPRLSMNWKRSFKSYVNLSQTERKLRVILRAFPMTTFRDYLPRVQQSAALAS